MPTEAGRTLDCFSDSIVLVSLEIAQGATGATTPLAALSQMGPELFPDGNPEIETEREDEVTVVFRDRDQNRIARVIVVDQRGWFVDGLESCES